MAYEQKCTKFNNEEDLQLDLILKGEEIAVSDTEGLDHHKNGFRLSLVMEVPWKLCWSTQAEGTEFQISDGYLVVDAKGIPSGPRAWAEDSPNSKSNT